jgi:hypothetical protein
MAVRRPQKALTGGIKMNSLLLAVLLFGLNNFQSARAQSLCADLRGHYVDCQVSAAYPEKINFEITQKIQGGEAVYTANFEYEAKPVSASFITDGKQRPVKVDGFEGPLPVALIYKATCDARSLIGIVWDSTISSSATEKFIATRDSAGNLLIVDQSLVFGKVVQEKRFTCAKQN